MKNSYGRSAGVPALITLVGAIGLAPVASAQMWAADVNSAVGAAIVRYEAHQQHKRPHRSYYRTSRTIPLGEIVDETGTNTRGAWQARLSRDAASIGIPTLVNPR